MGHIEIAISTIILMYFDSTFPLENLALGKPTWELHPWSGSDVDFGSENAVDGLYTDRGQGGQCTISENKQTTAEWRVDLGSVVSISHIDIHYRTENFPKPGPYVKRMAGFFLYVSNTTSKEDGNLCFHEIQTVAGTPTEDQRINCSVHGRYVIYYNERRPDVVYPSYYSQYAYNELCEVEVYDSPPKIKTTIDASLPYTTPAMFSTLTSTVKPSPVQPTTEGSSSFNTNDFLKTNTTYKSTIETTSTTQSLDVLQILHFKSNSQVLREGTSAWFELLLLTNKNYEIKWFHDGYLITNSSTRFKITTLHTKNDFSTHHLYIAHVLQRDQGEWKIVISKTYATRNLTVNVIPGLVIKMKPRYDFSVRSGEGIHLQCAVSNPEALVDDNEGNLIMKKDGSTLADVSFTNGSIIWSKSAAIAADSGGYTCLHTGYLDPVSASVNIIVILPEQKTCQSEMSDGIFWTNILAGSTKEEPCPGNQQGIATRYCDLSGKWQTSNLINCSNEVLMNASAQLDSILEDGLYDKDRIAEAVNNTLQLMKNLTSSSNEISAGDLSASLDILEKIVTVTNNSRSAIEEEAFYAVVDNVLSTNYSASWKTVGEKTEKDASFILKNMGRLGEVVIQNDNITMAAYSGFNFELMINKSQIAESGIRFPEVSSKNDTTNLDDVYTFLELPKQNQITENAVNYFAVIYKTMSKILPSSLDRSEKADLEEETAEAQAVVSSPILSLTTQTGLGMLVPPLKLTFEHVKNIEPREMYAVCVSWNFTISKWTERGCAVNQSDSKRTVCQCNHLTNFAILMKPYSEVTEDRQSLKTMSLVGVIISIVFTFLTFVIYALLWRYIKSDQNIIMLNLCGSLILSYVIFISAVEETGNEGLCIGITATIHYLFLVTFLSMLGMGVYYFMSITVTYYAMYVANNFKSKSRLRWFLLGVWGIPAIITATTLGAFYGKNYHQKYYCWLSMESGSLYMFIIPVCLIIGLNLLITCSLVRVLCASSVMTKSSLHKKATSAVRSLGTLIPVLGVTWLFGILAVNEKAEIFQYIFVIANSLQGLFIFVSHVVLNKIVMQGLRNKFPAFSTLTSFAEDSRKDTTSVSRSQSTSRSNIPMMKTKKKGLIESYHALKTAVNKKSILTEKTMTTDCLTSVSSGKNVASSENESTSNTLELISEGRRTRSRFRLMINLNPSKKKYNVTEM